MLMEQVLIEIIIFYDDDIKEIDFYKEKGIEFMFASGRDMNMMLDMIKKSHVDGDLIINNGTQYRNIEGTKNIVHPMDKMLLER